MCDAFSQVLNEPFLSAGQTSRTGGLAHCNTGTSIMHKFSYMGNPIVWVNPKGLANILSFHELEQQYEITYRSKAIEGAFIVHTNQGNIIFNRNEIGKYRTSTHQKPNQQCAMCLINTVQDNYKGFRKKIKFGPSKPERP